MGESCTGLLALCPISLSSKRASALQTAMGPQHVPLLGELGGSKLAQAGLGVLRSPSDFRVDAPSVVML